MKHIQAEVEILRIWPLLTACSGSLFVAARTRTVNGCLALAPKPAHFASSRTRNSFACVGAGISPISSSSNVPASASSKQPMRLWPRP